MDYIFLCAVSRISGIYSTRPRLFIGAVIGAVYAVFSVIFVPNSIISAILNILTTVLMIKLSFPLQNPMVYLRLSVLFFAISCAAAGGAFALGNLSKTTFFTTGGYYVDVPLRLVAAMIAISWVLSGLIFQRCASDAVKPPIISSVRLTSFGKTADFTLLVDTGNALCDPISGRPALIIDKQGASKLLPCDAAIILSQLNPDNAAIIFSSIPISLRRYFRLLPYHAVGKDGGMLIAFMPEKAVVDGKTWHGLVAISANSFSVYNGLIGL